MKVAIVQFDANEEKLWKVHRMAAVLSLVQTADLVLFPEYMPFVHPVPIEKAKTALCTQSESVPGVAFMAGGLVNVGGVRRNTVFLVEGGKILGTYFKRLLWQEDDIFPGSQAVRFDWSKGSGIPLICADAGDNPSPTGTRLMYESLCQGAGPNTPILLCTYGAWFNEPYWQKPLSAWAAGCNAPVVVCAVSGKGEPFVDEGISGHYGGGGSGVFWPEGVSHQEQSSGIYIIDLMSRSVSVKNLPK